MHICLYKVHTQIAYHQFKINATLTIIKHQFTIQFVICDQL